jgi:hypothetical protein
MALHESFWVVVGTASPVVAVTSVVALGQLMGDLTRELGGGRKPDLSCRRRRFWYPRLPPIMRAYSQLIIAFVLSFAVLAASLYALMVQRDFLPLAIPFVAIVLAMFLVLAQLFAVGEAQLAALRGFIEDSPRPPEGDGVDI